MRTVFVDTNYWVAVINPNDQWHQRAAEVKSRLGLVRLVTTELILVELLNYFCAYRPDTRQIAVKVVHHILASPEIEIISHAHDTFLAGLALYEARPDKAYSLTDCVSMNVMRERGINDVLTHDNHFAQEGFTLLL